MTRARLVLPLLLLHLLLPLAPTVAGEAVTLELDVPERVHAHAAIPVTVRLHDEAGEPLADQDVTVRLEGGAGQDVRTDADGVVRAFLEAPGEAGTVRVEAVHADGDAETRAVASVAVVHKAVLRVQSFADAVPAGGQQRVVLQLERPDGDGGFLPVAGRDVEVRLAGSSVATLRTDEVPLDVLVPVPAATPAGTHHLEAVFAGDDHHDAATAQTGAFTVRRTALVHLDEVPAFMERGRAATVAGRLVDAHDGTPLPPSPVHASLGGDAVVEGRSDADGRFRLTVRPAADHAVTGEQEVLRVDYDGSATRPASHAEALVRVAARPVFHVGIHEAEPGTALALAGELRLDDGSPVAAPVELLRGDEVVARGHSGLDGTFRLAVEVSADAAPGLRTYLVRTGGVPERGWLDASAAVAVRVPGSVALHLDATELPRNLDALPGRAVDARGKPVAGRLTADWNGPAPATLDVGSDGRFHVPIPAGLDPGHASLTLSFTPRDAATPAAVEHRLLTVAPAVHVQAPERLAWVLGAPARVEVAAVDEDGRPVEATLGLRLDDSPFPLVDRSVSGASWNGTTPAVPTGPHFLHVTVSSPRGWHLEHRIPIAVQAPTRLDVDAEARGDALRVSMHLGGPGAAAPDRTVCVETSPPLAASYCARTGSDGHATLHIPAALEGARVTAVRATFVGDDHWSPAGAGTDVPVPGPSLLGRVPAEAWLALGAASALAVFWVLARTVRRAASRPREPRVFIGRSRQQLRCLRQHRRLECDLRSAGVARRAGESIRSHLRRVAEAGLLSWDEAGAVVRAVESARYGPPQHGIDRQRTDLLRRTRSPLRDGRSGEGA